MDADLSAWVYLIAGVFVWLAVGGAIVERHPRPRRRK